MSDHKWVDALFGFALGAVGLMALVFSVSLVLTMLGVIK